MLCYLNGIWAIACSKTDYQFRSTALYRIQFGRCVFVPMPCFYSETNEWLKNWVMSASWVEERLCWNHQIFISHIHTHTNLLVTAWNLQSIQTHLTLKLSQFHKRGTFSSRMSVAAHSYCCWLGDPVFVLDSPSVPEACPKSLAIDFAVKNLDCLLE